MSWAADFLARSVHAIGALEVLGAVGVVLPGIARTAPVLVPLAAGGLALLQLGSAVVNVRYHATNRLPHNIILFALGVVVAWGRFGTYPL